MQIIRGMEKDLEKERMRLLDVENSAAKVNTIKEKEEEEAENDEVTNEMEAELLGLNAAVQALQVAHSADHPGMMQGNGYDHQNHGYPANSSEIRYG